MNKTKNKKLDLNLLRSFLVMGFCLLIGICILYVLFSVYTPSKNAIGALVSVTMDVVCILILFILLGSFALDRYGLKQTTRLYMCLLVGTAFAMFLDFLNWAFDGRLEFYSLTYWFTVGSLCMGAVMACLFTVYLYSYMEETHGLVELKRSARLCAILNIVSFALSVVLALTGTAFSFVDGHYKTGVLYEFVTLIPVLTLLHLAGITIRYVKRVGKRDMIAVVGYILLMIIGALIESEYNVGTTYVGVAIADIYIYVMLQNVLIAREQRSILEWKRKSLTDGLTGFNNRYAYDNDLAAFEKNGVPDNFVYASMDINSLKTVNDTLGHTAGDELILGAADCLKKVFSKYGKLYRTGGDEFIALILVENDQLDSLWNKFKEMTNSWSGELVDNLTISIGYVTKKEAEDMSVKKMAVLADTRMYEAKREYYKDSGIERRRV